MSEQEESPKRRRTGSIIAMTFAALLVGYLLLLGHLAVNTVQQENVFPSRLEELTDNYVSYLDPAGNLKTQAEAVAWLTHAQTDLRDREQETILLGELTAWIAILRQVPGDVYFEDMINARDDQSVREALAGLRKACVEADPSRLDRAYLKHDLNTREGMKRLGGFAYVVYFRTRYLAGKAPMGRTVDLQTMRFEKRRVSEVLADLEAAQDRIARGKDESTQIFLDSLTSLKERKGDPDFIETVNGLRTEQAPEEAKKRLLFFGPICLRRLSESLDAPSPRLRQQAWEVVLAITAFGEKERATIAYRPDADSAARRKAIARLAELCWKPKDWPADLEPGLKYIY